MFLLFSHGSGMVIITASGSPILQDDMNKILPIINTSGSDSAMLDNALEFMVIDVYKRQSYALAGRFFLFAGDKKLRRVPQPPVNK